MIEIDHILSKVSRSARYVGGEWNSIKKDWKSADVRLAFAYPDSYEIGMSNLGLAILYDLLNKDPDVIAERVYAPWPDMATEMRDARIPLFSLESRHAINGFDILGFSLGYELTYTNVLEMLDLAQIPILAAERSDCFPLIIAGGSCALNPEPMSDFIDLFVIGEGEEIILELVEIVRAWKNDSAGSKGELLRELAKIQGAYVPAFYRVEYESNRCFSSIEPTVPEAKKIIERRIVTNLPPPVTSPVVPFVEVIHDRGAVEIQRGCMRSCRFCQASFIYRPLRERSVTDIVMAVEELVENCGYDEVSLLSLSTSDYSELSELIPTISDRCHTMHLNLSLPSLRPDSFSVELAESVQGQKKSGLTFAPEAGTERLRQVINKCIADDEFLQSIELALNKGWRSFKLYFMIGLPTETKEDIQGIVDLVRRARSIRGSDGKRPNLKVNISTFISKPHVPFQRVALNTEDELTWKHQILKQGLRKAEANFSWHDPHVSLLEGVISRGDRLLGKVIYRAWQLGCQFDAWSDRFDFQKWLQAFEDCDLDPQFYVRERSPDEALPWDHIDTGVSPEFLNREYRRAVSEAPSGDCISGPCLGCGLQTLDEACSAKYRE